MYREPGEKIKPYCGNSMHGRISRYFFSVDEHDPDCQTCAVRAMLADHDHLHLGGEKCLVLGIGGNPGESVKCSCGSYHH